MFEHRIFLRRTMKSLFLVPTGLTVITALASACSDCNDDRWKLYYAVTDLNFRLLDYQYHKNPTKSHAVTAFPLLCVLAQMVFMQSNGPNDEKLLEILNADNKEAVKRYMILAQEAIKQYDKNVDRMEFKVVANKSHPLTKTFKRNFAQYCNGIIDYGDGNNYAASSITKWRQSQQSQGYDAGKHVIPKYSLDFEIYRNFLVNPNHINNPTGITLIDFQVNKEKTVKVGGVYGNAYVKYVAIKKPDAKIVEVSLAGDQYSVLAAVPNNLDDLPALVKKMTNIHEYFETTALMKPMCVKLKYILIAKHMLYNMTEYLHHRGVNLEGYHDVFKNYQCDAKINSIFEEVRYVISPVSNRTTIHSPKCPGNCKYMPKVSLDRPVVYHILRKIKEQSVPIISGILTETARGGDL